METTMKIFDQEVKDGIASIVQSTASISYASAVEPCKTLSKIDKSSIKSLASINDDDLYYVQSILVTSSWNKNDDVFDKLEVWAARNTPEDKPTNLEHDENTIIGHITSNWPITESGEVLDSNLETAQLPDKFHILTGSVIYTGFSNPELKQRATSLIEQIESGNKYVSMECYFKGFDYGLIDKSTGEYKVLARNNTTAYLTKFLRAYGGMGEHDNYKIGRVLRDITFSGKGFVDKPANPDSIIFTKNSINDNFDKIFEEKNENLSIAGVSDNQSNPNVENITMSLDLEPMIKDVAEMKTKLETIEAKASQVAQDAIATLEAKNTELQNTVSSYETKISELSSALEALTLEKEEAAKKMKEDENSKDEENKNLKATLETANEVIAGYKKQEEEMKKKEKNMKRMAMLIELGVDNETASAAVGQFENVDDEVFTAVTSLFAASKPAWLDKTKKEEEMKKEKTKKSDASDTEALETVEVSEEVNLGIGGDTESSVESTRAALVEYVYNRLGKKPQ